MTQWIVDEGGVTVAAVVKAQTGEPWSKVKRWVEAGVFVFVALETLRERIGPTWLGSTGHGCSVLPAVLLFRYFARLQAQPVLHKEQTQDAIHQLEDLPGLSVRADLAARGGSAPQLNYLPFLAMSPKRVMLVEPLVPRTGVNPMRQSVLRLVARAAVSGQAKGW